MVKSGLIATACPASGGMKIVWMELIPGSRIIMCTTEFNKMLVSNSEFLKPFAVTLTKDSEVAKDLFQETLYRALMNRDKYDVGTNIKAWLYTIMRNVFINQYRKRVRRRAVMVSVEPAYLADLGMAYASGADSNMAVKDIMTAIHQLPVVFNLPFLLYFQGFHYQEISRMLREPLGTIKSRIHFARKMLREQLSRG